MSAQDTTVREATESARSSFKLIRNAKADTQIEIRIAVGDSKEELDAAEARAIAAYERLSAHFAPRSS